MIAAQPPEPFRWKQLESPDLKVYIANLRAFGCSERTIRDLVRAELDRLYEPRHRELESSPPDDQKYWEPRHETSPISHYERRLQHEKLEREKEALLTELLGEPNAGNRAPGEPPGAHAPGTAGEKPMTPEMEAQVHAIQEKYAHRREQVFEQSEGRIYPADAARLQELQGERLAELSQVLSPEQLQEFELREGPLADRLRHELEPFQPTEEEFRAIHEVRQSFAAESGYGEFDFEDPAHRREREQVEEQLNEQLKAVLGEERFAQYKIARDPRFRDLYALGDRFDLPAENVGGMYDLWRRTEQRIDQLHADPSLAPEQRRQLMQAMRGELEVEAEQLLGDAAYYNYRSRGGEWMWHMFGEEP